LTAAALLGGFTRRAGAAACAVVCTIACFGGRVSAGGVAQPAYFSYPFGGQITRIASGPGGAVYVAGWTTTADLPASTSSPAPLIVSPLDFYVAGFLFVAALAPDGTPRWTSYVRAIADANVSPPTQPLLAVAPDGSAWITGACAIETTNPFQTYSPGTRHAYVARFAPDGTLAFASLFGGSGQDSPSGLAVAPDGDAVVAGTTFSTDFPIAPSAAGVDSAFVARIAADGSGLVGGRRLGGAYQQYPQRYVQGGDVAIDPLDGSIVLGCVGPAGSADALAATMLDGPVLLPPSAWRLKTYVLRLAPDGSTIAAAGLDVGEAAGGTSSDVSPAPLTLASDGAVVVGGYLAQSRLDHSLTRIEASRRTSYSTGFFPTRFVGIAGGRVAAIGYVTSNLWPPPDAVNHPGVHVYDPSLAEDARPDLSTLNPRDLALGTDGALLLAGPWTASTFNVPPGVTPRRGGSFVTKVPLDGATPPSAARVRVRGPDTADLTWTNDGDAPLRFDLESRQTVADPLDAFVGGTAAGDTSAARIAGLVPGSDLEFRVVAVYPSGVRAGVSAFGTTPPVPPGAVTVTPGADNRVVVRWQDANGSATGYDVQRRVGTGEWIDVRYGRPWYENRPPLVRDEQDDVVPDGAAPVVYRVRAMLRRMRTPWVVADPLVPAPTLRVTQTFGHVRSGGAAGHLDVAGTIAPVAGGGISFDPSTQDLRVLYGDALAPSEFVVPRGDTGWTESGGAWTWSAARTLSGWGQASRIVLDLPHGTFSVLLERSPYAFQQWTRSVAINLAFGGVSGGEVRVWRGTLRRLALR
jgi:hypothetical protein